MTCIVDQTDIRTKVQYVYVIRNLVDEKVYVGRTKNPLVRKRNHFSLARRGSDRYLYRAIRAHGEENFSFEILEECADDVVAECEQYWVEQLDSYNPERGYNLTSGGEGVRNYKHSDETLQKIKRARSKQVITDEHKRQISQGLLRTSQTKAVRESRRQGQAKRPPCKTETKLKRSESHRRWCHEHRDEMIASRQKLRHCSKCHGVGHNKRNCTVNV